ncbi:unnamed protein product [Schistosoma margrebowiei]|uniref:Neurofascin/L1/NrCAM C-terminal domain-containing protein n=1 Tax=Schistosoma margrebowiei TaxID=48269 RepID=A0A3P8H5B2_9TREM|nr:unnamed protein product [Schistosoma margrebowiei]
MQFIPVSGVRHDIFFYEHPGLRNPIEIDATIKQQVRIRIVEHLNELPVLRIHCVVAPLDSTHELVSAYLCRRKSTHDSDECIDPKTRNVIFGRVEFSANGNRSSGMVRRPVKQTEYLPPLSINDLPLSLECGQTQVSEELPSWADAAFPSPFMWSFCDVDSPDGIQSAGCMRRVRQTSTHVTNYFESYVSPNGTLVLYKRTTSAWKDMGLVCWSHLDSSAVYSTYFGGSSERPKLLTYDSNIPFVGSGITVLSPLTQRITVRIGPRTGLKLVTKYRSTPEYTTVKWTKDGRRIPPDFPGHSDYLLKFPDLIRREHSGTYNLLVDNGNDQVNFQFIVSVVGPPEVIHAPPPLLLVMEGENVTFSCQLDSFITESLEINGLPYQPNPTNFRTELRDQYPYLKDALIQPLQKNGHILTYSAYNLLFTPGSKVGPTHTVSLVGKNEYGLARVSTLVRVLPRINILKAPKDYSCTTDCLNTISHAFDCVIDTDPYQSTYFVQTWELNGIPVSKMTKDYQQSKFIKTEGTKLIITPVDDPSLTVLFRKVNVTCRWRIFYPHVTSRIADLDTRLLEPNMKVYDSHEDAKIRPLMTAALDLQVDHDPTPASANISWITAVIIGILVIIAIGVLTACLVMRFRGETYMLDREERALGNDPEKELREKEAFQTYERAEEPPLRGSRCSLNDDSAEIGSDGDGELDDYNLDPGKFNEEGSFIGEYATERHKGPSNRLPTLDRNYNPTV